MASDPKQDLALELIKGEVLMPYPGLGMYLVLPEHGDVYGSLILCTDIEGTLGRTGIRGGTTYEAGCPVLVARAKTPPALSLGTRQITYIGFILGRAPSDAVQDYNGFRAGPVHVGSDLDIFDLNTTEAYATARQLEDTMRDLSYGTSTDNLPGEFIKYGPLHTFLTVCSSKSSVGASPLAAVEAFAFDDKVRILARRMEVYGFSIDSGFWPEGPSMLYSENRAYSEKEGLGAIGEAAVMTEDEQQGPTLTDETQRGVFRHRKLAGRIVNGEQDTVASPLEEPGTVRKSDTAGDLTMSYERRAYDGTAETRSVSEISHVKSAYIPMPQQLKDLDGAHEDIPVAPAQDTYENTFPGERPYSAFASYYESQATDHDTEQTRYRMPGSRPGYWKLLTRTQLEELLKLDISSAVRTLEVLDDHKDEYEEPPYVQVKDPSTELERRLYALESIIRQSPDGSITVADGHGSEIRMFRGKITISPSADLEIRPGRDLRVMAPRRAAIVAQEEVQLVSEKGKVRVKADTDLDMLSGNSGEGRTLIASLAPGGDTDRLSGVVIKSEGNVGMFARSMYMGPTPLSADLTKGRSDSGRMQLVMDCGLGGLSLLARSMYGRFDSGFSFSTPAGFLGLLGGESYLLGGAVNINGKARIMTPSQTTITQQILTTQGLLDDTTDIQGTPGLDVEGSMLLAGSLTMSGNLRAAGVSALSGTFNNATPESGMQGRIQRAPDINFTPFNISNIGAYANNLGVSMLSSLSDALIYNALFSYDKPEDIGTEDCQMDAMKWQLMLGNSGTWVSTAVKDAGGVDTWAYPGRPPTDLAFNLGINGKTALSGYIINRS